jgi:hypothetical protein
MASVRKGIVNVGGIDFRWSVFRLPVWTRVQDVPKLLGMAILVERPEPGHRDLLLEFAIDPNRHGDMPQHQRFHLPNGRLLAAIEEAIQAGYDPDSRGKRFVHEAGFLQPR